MLKNHVSTLITKNLQFSPTKGQKKIISELSGFVTSHQQDEMALIKGYAGTGKTTIISALVKSFKELRLKVVLMAPTGRAAKVLMNYSNHSAYTIHKKIYRQKSSKDGFGEFVPDVNLHRDTIFVVDEASMINNQSGEYTIFGSGRLLDDLISYVYNNKNCKLILVGDTAQLPPVHLDVSPALDKNILEGFGFSVHEFELKEVVRQNVDSGILMNATTLREQISNEDCQINFNVSRYDDIKRMPGNDLIESIESSIDRYGIEDVIILCRSNKRANQYNKGIRERVLHLEEEIAKGDLLMVVKNNYFWLEENESVDFIANGDIIQIIQIHGYQELYGFRFADVTIKLIDYDSISLRVNILLDTLDIDGPALPANLNKEFFFKVAEDYADIKTKKNRYNKVREDKYFNALQVKFAYAVTCHKAQGGQWKIVYIDQGYITDEMINKEYLRWLYTAFTRGVERLYLINFRDGYFDD